MYRLLVLVGLDCWFDSLACVVVRCGLGGFLCLVECCLFRFKVELFECWFMLIGLPCLLFPCVCFGVSFVYGL